METELKNLIAESLWERDALTAIGDRLPPDDSRLTELLEETIEKSDTRTFIFLLMAALGKERVISASMLARSAHLVPSFPLLGTVLFHLHKGEDLPEVLIEASRLPMIQENRALCLLWAVKTCVDERDGVIPPELLVEARLQARSENLRDETIALLNMVGTLTQDKGLRAILYNNKPVPAEKKEAIEQASLKLLDAYMVAWKLPVLFAIPEKLQQWGPGSNVRRAVPKTGRNDPCHCNSGKKYKRCCEANDKQRLRLSSHVPGKTMAEVNEAPEPHVTLASLQNTHACELVRYDVEKLDPEVLPNYIVCLGAFRMVEKIVSTFETLGCPEELHRSWRHAQLFLVNSWRADLAHRLLAVRRDDPDLDTELEPDFRLLLASTDPAGFLALLQQEIVSQLQDDTPGDGFFMVANALLHSPHSALGILVARSIIPFLSKSSASGLHKQLLMARDRLQLSPYDPISDVLYRRYSDEVQDHGEDAAALREARKRLDAKTSESRKLQAQIDHLRHELQHQEQKAKAQRENPSPTQPPADPQIVKDLRTKVTALKGLLDEQHHQRAALSEDLQKAYAELKASRSKQPEPAPVSADDANEDALTLPSDFGDQDQPIRLVAYPQRFRETLHAFPSPLARSVMALLGRLAAGESSAFRNVRRLTEIPEYYRARIGRDHRILFRLEHDAIKVTDLINRRDLEKSIKSIKRSQMPAS